MSGIRVNNGAKRIEVNDEGDYIVLDFGDSSFPDRFFSMIDRIQERTRAATAQAEDIEAQHQKGSDGFLRATAALWRKVHEDIRDELDSFFGPDTCRHVFGNIVPDISLYDDFFDQLMPYFHQYAKEHNERMQKYSADRRGNV